MCVIKDRFSKKGQGFYGKMETLMDKQKEPRLLAM